MTQKPLAIAAVLGALIIAGALVYHGRQLAEVSRRLEAMDQRTSNLDTRLDKFSHDLPTLVEQAGHDAGRQAVHGMIEEVVQTPLKWLRSQPAHGESNVLAQTGWPLPSSNSVPEQGGSWVRFEIRDPVVKIEILPNLKELPAFPWPHADGKEPVPPQTNQAASARDRSTTEAETN